MSDEALDDLRAYLSARDAGDPLVSFRLDSLRGLLERVVAAERDRDVSERSSKAYYRDWLKAAHDRDEARDEARNERAMAKRAIEAARRCLELEGPSMERHRQFARERGRQCLCRWCELDRALEVLG